MRIPLLIYFIIAFLATKSHGQEKQLHGNGIKHTAQDSSFSIKFNTRFQTLYEAKINTSTNDWSDKLMIRRFRLKFGGFAYNPKFEYKIELALSNRDQRVPIQKIDDGSNMVLDAVLKWHFAKNWQLWFGQTKLPGNRERVISSQQMQFVDRSNLNARFNLDRDKGIQLHHEHQVGKNVFKETGSVSMGEGRNIIDKNTGGYDYTLRAEYLPFGEFQADGDYFGADLEREKTPRLAFGFTYDYNDHASRTRGQLGDYLEETSSLKSYFIDMIFKYKGFSLMSEYVNKKIDNGSAFGIEEGSQTAINPSGDLAYFYTGTGLNIQSGYVFKNNFEIATRYTKLNPEHYNDNRQYTLGLSKYISKHTLKIQSDITLIEEIENADIIMFRLQVEIGI
ncbi:porin [Reichenbachiella sp. MALMAid0571]|uniref:porin n=1 Tax=Reichenbachiella sp. MALMAid0571 TaxID=3143939 RepID=UPI0032DF0328